MWSSDGDDDVPTCRLTYAQLEGQAGYVARALLGPSYGLQPGEPVAIILPRAALYYAAMLGVLRAGAAYVPIDPTYPADRITFTLSDSAARVVLTHPPLMSACEAYAPRGEQMASVACICMYTHIHMHIRIRMHMHMCTGEQTACVAVDAALLVLGDAEPAEAAPAVIDPPRRRRRRSDHNGGGAGGGGEDDDDDDLCYLLYTSGSTGRPKGVVISQRNAVNLVLAEGLLHTHTCTRPHTHGTHTTAPWTCTCAWT